MGTIPQKLQKTLENKQAIKQALIDKRKTPGDNFSNYSGIIDELTNTDDATVKANHIMNNEIAYGVDGQVIGTAPLEYIESTGTIILPVNAKWQSITYGDGKFVAITYGNSNIAAYSTDGINWVQSTLPVEANWYSVTYGDGKFVAVSQGTNIAAYSYDGINWDQGELPLSAIWQSVAYGDGKFVTIPTLNTIAAYSYDGINWEYGNLPTSADWRSVTYGDGKFVAVAGGNSNINVSAYSADGINWEQSELPVKTKWKSVTYGDGKFVAISTNNSNIAAYSEDGINWEQSQMSINTNWQSVTYGDGKFIIINTSSNIAAYSYDGINWEQSELPVSANWKSVTYGDGKFVAVAYDNNTLAYSTDGITWSNIPPENYKVLEDGLYLSNNIKTRKLISTDNELRFKGDYSTENATIQPYDIMNNEIAYGVDGQVVGTAPFRYDGITKRLSEWTQIELPVEVVWYSVTYGDGKFVAVAYGDNEGEVTNIAAYSADGINWEQSELPEYAWWTSVAYGDGLFVAIGTRYDDNEECYTVLGVSTDGINWFDRTSDGYVNFGEAYFTRIIYNNGVFIINSEWNSTVSIIRRTDFTYGELDLQMLGYDSWCSIAYGNGKFVAVASDTDCGSEVSDIAAYLEDGKDWEIVTLPIKAAWSNVVYANGKFVVLGDVYYDEATDQYSAWYDYYKCVTAISDDGINWTLYDNKNVHDVGLGFTAEEFKYNNGLFTISSFYSEDAINWFDSKLSLNGIIYTAYGDGKIVAVSDIANNIPEYAEVIENDKYKVLDTVQLSANGYESTTLSIIDNQIILDNMFISEDTLI